MQDDFGAHSDENFEQLKTLAYNVAQRELQEEFGLQFICQGPYPMCENIMGLAWQMNEVTNTTHNEFYPIYSIKVDIEKVDIKDYKENIVGSEDILMIDVKLPGNSVSKIKELIIEGNILGRDYEVSSLLG